MYLSDEQNLVVRHGLDSEPTWSWAEMPVGPQQLPRWAKGLHVRTWYVHHGNPPDFVLKCDDDLRRWDGMAYEINGHRYMASHPDGRADIYYHSGAVALRELERPVRVNGEWITEKYTALATTPQEGFGGAHYPLKIKGGAHHGKTVLLRGPWHGPSPAGYLTAAYVDMKAKWRGNGRPRHARPWHTWTPMGGLYIKHELFLLLVARFQPHLRVARVTTGTRSWLELVRPDWRCPKSCMPFDDRRRLQDSEPRPRW